MTDEKQNPEFLDALAFADAEIARLTASLAAEREREDAAETRVNVLCVAVSQLEAQLEAQLVAAAAADAVPGAAREEEP
jgi:hypothetical protein